MQIEMVMDVLLLCDVFVRQLILNRRKPDKALNVVCSIAANIATKLPIFARIYKQTAKIHQELSRTCQE